MKNILLLGGSGFVGKGLWSCLGSQRATSTWCTTPIEGGVHFDALTMSLAEIPGYPDYFSHAILLLGETNPDACAADPEACHHLNVEATVRIIDQLLDANITPIFCSTEVVFNGQKGNYIESDTPDPLLRYGQYKLEIERYLQKRGTDKSLVVRLARVFGSHPNDGTLFTGLLGQVQKNHPFACASDQIFSPIHMTEVAQLLEIAMVRELRGLFHLAGPQPISRREALEMVIQNYHHVTGYRMTTEITYRSLRDFPAREPRPLNVSMMPDKLLDATGFSLRSPASWCRQIVSKICFPFHNTPNRKIPP